MAVVLLVSGFGRAFSADLVITNARVFSGTDDTEIPRASITLSGGRIERISRGAATAASGATVIDAGGKTVMPGLIQGHIHLFRDVNGHQFIIPKSDAEVSEYIEHRLKPMLENYLHAGFTSVLSAGDLWPQIADVRDSVAAGKLKGPRLFIAGSVFQAPGGIYVCGAETQAKKAWCEQHMFMAVDTAQAARAGVQQLAARGVDAIVYDAVTNSRGFSSEVVAAMADEAHKHGLRVLVHNSDAKEVNELLQAGIDGFVHPPSITFDCDGSLLRGAGRKHVPVAITLGGYEDTVRSGQATQAQRSDYVTSRQNVMMLLKAGAVPVFGLDKAGVAPQEMVGIVGRSMSEVGLSNAQVLRSATRDAARSLLGRKDLGTLEPGQ
ncbi:MAG: amidohydrolase family protein, partial [Steroidobacteraceae bacterium]